MRIVYVHHTTAVSGAVVSLANLIQSIDERGVEKIVLMPNRPGHDDVSAMFERAGARVILETSLRPFHGSTVAPFTSIRERGYAIAGLLPTILASRSRYSAIGPTLIHLNSTCMVGAAIASKSLNKRIPVIAHVREPLLQSNWGRLLATLNRRNVDYFIGIDDTSLTSVVEDPSRSAVIHNSVGRDLFDGTASHDIKGRYQWPSESVVFLFLARLTPFNGALELVNTIIKHAESFDSRARFLISGFDQQLDSYGREVQAAVARSNLCGSLSFTTEIGALIRGCDVVIAPFITPHSARSVLEAAAAGKPSLVSNVQNLSEMVDPEVTGLIYALEDSEDLVDKINRLCVNNFRERLGQSAREQALAKYQQSLNKERVMKVYRALLSERSRRARMRN